MSEYKFSSDSDTPVEDINKFLSTLDLKQDDVSEMEVRISTDPSFIESKQKTLEDLPAEVYKSDIEYGPVPESERKRLGYRGHKPKPDSYKGERHKDAVMPDTQHATILRTLRGKWLTSTDIAEKLDMDPQVASAYLSADFKDNGYVKRRGDIPYEYSLDIGGREALKFGQKMMGKKLPDEIEDGINE